PPSPQDVEIASGLGESLENDPDNVQESIMKKICAASIAALLVATGGTAFAQAEAETQMSQAECQSLWNRADAQGTGSLTPAQADNFVSNFSAADVDSDGALTNAEFLAACQQ